MSIVMRQQQSNQMGGDVHMSARLRLAFHSWCGNRTATKALADAGIPIIHGRSWLGEKCVLRQCEQDKLTEIPAINKLLERIP